MFAERPFAGRADAKRGVLDDAAAKAAAAALAATEEPTVLDAIVDWERLEVWGYGWVCEAAGVERGDGFDESGGDEFGLRGESAAFRLGVDAAAFAGAKRVLFRGAPEVRGRCISR